MVEEEISLEDFATGSVAAADFNILDFVPEDKAILTSAITKATKRSQSSVNNRLKKAAAKGLTERRMVNGKYYWALTELGRDVKSGKAEMPAGVVEEEETSEKDEDWDEDEEEE